LYYCYLSLIQIDPKRAIPREEQEKTEKIFVGGVKPEVTEEEFKEYFSQFGNVVEATLMSNKDTGRPRGFGFITFDNDQSVEAVLAKQGEIIIKDKPVSIFLINNIKVYISICIKLFFFFLSVC